jgi:4-amino-4-deoxy-L-arabinose transferase-like glycosyltransferase
MHWKNIARYVPITCIVILAVLFRFVYLDRIPAAIGGDELIYPITAKAVALTGKDLTGTWNIFQSLMFRYPPNQQAAELPYFLNLPLSGYFPFSVLATHLPFAILSAGTVLLFYFIAELLFGAPAALCIALIAAVNPWLVVMGRTGYESTPATFFYLLGFYLLLRLKSWNILWSIPPFILAFYSYIATKVIFIPFIICTAILAYVRHGYKYKIQYVVTVFFSIVFVGFFIITLMTSPRSSRISEILLPNAPEITAQVNESRKLSIASPVAPILTNKYSVYVQTLTNRLFKLLSTSYLFTEGDLFFPIHGHAMFYAVDFLLFLLGCLFLFNKRKLYFVCVAMFFFVGAFPQTLFKSQSEYYSLHLAMMFPVIVLCIGYGMYGTLVSFPKRYRYLLGGCIAVLYLGNVINFGYIYFFQYPLQEYGDGHMRILSQYLHLSQKRNVPVSVYSDSNIDFLNKYLFYTNSLSQETISILQKTNYSNGFVVNGINFYSCKKSLDMGTTSGVIIINASCSTETMSQHLSISRLTDGGEIYKIYHDSVCGTYNLQPYPNHITIAELAVDSLSEKQFCETYINRR